MSSAPWRVLVADDDPTVGLLAQATLAGSEFIATVVDNGSDALTALQGSSFDMALLDVEMPGLDGFAVGEAIRRHLGDSFPVVLISGRRDPEFIARARQLAAGYISKPIDWGALSGLLRSLLRRDNR